MNRFAIVSLATLALTALASAQTWTKISTTTTPSARTSVVSVFNPFRQRTMLYGGRNSTLGIQETWTWNGKVWTQLKPKNSPPGKWAHNMVMDWHRKKVVLFGGREGTKDTNNTWEWDGVNWTENKTKTLPPKRRAQGMAYDKKRKVTVMFGGAGFPFQLGDTWEYDGKDWKQIKTTLAPTPRDHPRMVYDESRGVCVLFGGWDQKNGNKLMGDTWEYDGKTWTKITTKTSPAGRYWHNMVYDRQRARVIMNGGFTTDTWEYDGTDWKQITTKVFPLGASESASSFDWIRRRMVQFGGSNRGKMDTETWEYQGVDLASYSSWGKGCSGALLASATGSVPQLGKILTIQVTKLPPKAGVVALFFGASHDVWGPATLPLALDPLGMTGCALEISPDLMLPLVVKQAIASVSLPIPNSTTLLGSMFYNQTMVPDATANKSGWTMTNACRGVIGK